MILITGTNIDVTQLPRYETMDYQIDNANMNIKLKTVAKSTSCFQIFIAEDKRAEYTITDELSSKIKYFKDDSELIMMLENGGEIKPQKDIFDDDDDPVPEVVVPTFEPPKNEEVVEEKKEEKSDSKKKSILDKDDIETPADFNENSKDGDSDEIIPILDLPDADTDLPEDIIKIPNFSDDVDSLKLRLEAKDKEIAQREAMIREYENRINKEYEVQELQLREIQEEYEKKLTEAQEIISSLEKKAKTGNLDDNAIRLLRYINYANSYKGVLREEFTEEEQKQLGNLTSKFHIFACGAGDSCHKMLLQINGLIKKGTKSVIIDFSNDNALAAYLKLKTKSGNSMNLLDDSLNPVNLIQDVNGCSIIPTTNFNDIIFLSIDWIKLIRKINDLASGRDVILLFGNINSFNVRTVVTKLSYIGKLQIFVKCAPIVFNTLYSDTKFMPKEKINIVALEYIEVVRQYLDSLSKVYTINAFQHDVEWNKLGVK